jgi:hypothetical protein
MQLRRELEAAERDVHSHRCDRVGGMPRPRAAAVGEGPSATA